MPVKPIYQEVALADIDLADRTFTLAPPDYEVGKPPLNRATISLALLHPPLLRPGREGKMIVVSGRTLLTSLEQSSIGCLVLPGDTAPAIALEWALGSILASRPATALEQANCWSKAEKWLGAAEAGRRFGPQLELWRRFPPPRLSRLLELPPVQAAALQSGRLELTTAFRLLDLEKEDSALLFLLIERLQLSSSNQKKLVEICLELGRRHETSLAKLLDHPEAEAALAGPVNNPAQQTTRLLAWLTGQRYPRLTSATREFQSFITALSLPAGTSLEPSPAFERDSLRLTIEFKNRSELEKRWPALREILAALN